MPRPDSATPLTPRLLAIAESRARVLASLLLLLFLLLGAVSVYHDTPTIDEPMHFGMGARTVDGSLEHTAMTSTTINALNAVPKVVIDILGVTLSAPTTLWLARMPTLLLVTALGWYVFVWSSELYGARGGLLSLFLFVFCPTSMAHGRLITTDMPCAVFCFAAAFYFVRYMKQPSWATLLVAAAAMGVAQISKYTALWLLPVLLGAFIARRYAQRRARDENEQLPLSTVVLHGAVYLMVTLVILNVGYLFVGTFETLATHKQWLTSIYGYVDPANGPPSFTRSVHLALSNLPLPLPGPYLEGVLLGQFHNSTGAGHGPVYLLGERSQLGFPAYFPIAFLLKTPLPTLLLLALALVICVRSKRLRLDSDELVLLGASLSLLAYFSLLCTVQVGVRYLVPALPFLYVLAGQLVAWAPSGERAARFWRACLVALCVWLPVSVLSYYPHYISYFNELRWNRLELY
ncbi:MAG: glycosyltransferase family 39 protein, partial [Myxococcales bacterium]